MHTWILQLPPSYVTKRSCSSPIAFIKATTRSRFALSHSIYARIAATILYKEHQTKCFPHPNQHTLRQEATVTASSEWLLRPVWYQFSILLLCLYSLLHSVGTKSYYNKPPLYFFRQGCLQAYLIILCPDGSANHRAFLFLPFYWSMNMITYFFLVFVCITEL